MNKKRWIYVLFSLLILVVIGLNVSKKINFNANVSVGQPIDSLNGVFVYFNGGVENISGRNIAADGYNIGLKYQCVEFVKRYYYEHLHHKMPDSYGHAKDFFDNTIADSQLNTKRNLMQYTNPSRTKPNVDDLLIFNGNRFNQYGHVAIVSNSTDSNVEIIQQNAGPFSQSRETYQLKRINGKWQIENKRIAGWLRKVQFE